MSVTPLHIPEEDELDFTPFEFTEFAIRLKGEPIDLSRRPWLEYIYNMPVTWQSPSGSVDNIFDTEMETRRKMLLVFGRQSEKSTTIGNLLLALANLIPYLRLLYVTASNIQMREFSDERLRAVIADSPILSGLTGQGNVGRREVQNVQTKRWINQAKILLRSVYKNADRVRGIPADVLGIDEIQDVYTDSLPVIEETLFRSEIDGGPISIYSGTPKTFDNPLEFYWARYSTQNEWMTKCGCGKWHVIEDKHIGPTGLVCDICSREMNPVDGIAQWARLGKAGQEWEGFHLCQPIVAYSYKHDKQLFDRIWRGLLDKRKRYPKSRFLNEVMGRSYDAGTKPVTLAEMRECCLSDKDVVVSPSKGLQQSPSWAGVDWGSGDESFTILSIWHYDHQGRFALLYAKRYEGMEADPDFVVKDIIMWCRKFKVNLIGADWGFGFGMNSQLKKAFGASKVVTYFHSGGQKEKVKWDKLGGKFTTHRSRVLQDVFTLIKRGPVSGGLAMPGWENMNDKGQDIESFANDILAVYTEYSEARREIVFDHPRGVPDDFLHTVCYALLVSQFMHRRPDLHAPGPKVDFKK